MRSSRHEHHLDPVPLIDRYPQVFDLGFGHSYAWLWRRPLAWPAEQPWVASHDGCFPQDVYALLD